jgi:hypothetical protein
MVNIFYKNKYMETLRKPSFFLLAALVVSTVCRAQTAEEVVAKYTQAIGGKEVLANIKSTVMTTNVEVGGNDYPSVITILAGKGFKSETDLNGTKFIQCVSDHGGWTINPIAGQTTPTAIPDADVKKGQTQLSIAPLANYAANGGKIELAGKDAADYKIKYSDANGVKATYYISATTYLLDKAETTVTMQGQDVDVTVLFSDYRKIDAGVMVPFKIERNMPQYSLNITLTKVEVNTAVDPAIFEMPK